MKRFPFGFFSIRKYFFLLCTFLAMGCDIGDNVISKEASFLRIYDDSQFDGSYIPLDIQQTEDDGYLILAGKRIEESNFIGIQVLKLDKEGGFEGVTTIETEYVHPVSNFLKTEEGYFFFCMHAISLQAHIMAIDEDGVLLSATPVPNTYYPLAAGLADNGKFILQSYDNMEKQSVVAIVGADGKIGAKQGFGIGAGEEVEKPIIEHFTRTGRQLPFRAGKASNGMFYFNGFFNYTFSLLFTNLNNASPSGVVQGQQDDGGMSAVLPLGGGKFAAARFNFGDNYILPHVDIATQGISSSVDLVGLSVPELAPDAKVVLKEVVVNGKATVLYATNTKSGQILLLAYDALSGELLGTRYLGFSNPYEIAGFIQTKDDGLAVAALTYVAGRFPRVCLIKLSKDELADLGS